MDWGWGRKFRAYDKATGRVLWEIELPAGTTGGPITYMSKVGRYILVPSAGRIIRPSSSRWRCLTPRRRPAETDECIIRVGDRARCMTDRLDRSLGMDRDISRRDFLNGAAIALTGTLAHPWFESTALAQAAASAPEKSPDYYPPSRTGLRGTHDGAWEVAHALRDGRTWDEARDTGERYDLVVVGGGISGLAAAYFFRQAAGRDARILVLDNHDDFGGHAKRNEFTAAGRVWIGYGGTQAIEGRGTWSPVAKRLRDELGIDTDKFFTATDQTFYTKLGLGQGVFFDRETWGVDRLVKGGQGNPAEGPPPSTRWWREFAAQAPFTDTARRDFIRVHEENVDYLPGLGLEEKRARLRKISYRDFLRDYAKVDSQAIQYFQQRTHSGWGIGIDAVPATAGSWLAGFQGLGLPPLRNDGDPYIFHFPDGNASIARLLVRALIPSVAPGSTMEDVVTARFDYAKLDDEASRVRIRLNSTGVAAHVGRRTRPPRRGRHVRSKRARPAGPRRELRARVLQRDYPEADTRTAGRQKDALMYGVKTPLVYTNVLVRNWRAFQKLGVSHGTARLVITRSCSSTSPSPLVRTRHSSSPDEPDPPAPRSRPVQIRPAEARTASRRACGASADHVRDVRTSDERPARAHARRGRIRSRRGHPGHHRESLAAWIRGLWRSVD